MKMFLKNLNFKKINFWKKIKKLIFKCKVQTIDGALFEKWNNFWILETQIGFSVLNLL